MRSSLLACAQTASYCRFVMPYNVLRVITLLVGLCADVACWKLPQVDGYRRQLGSTDPVTVPQSAGDFGGCAGPCNSYTCDCDGSRCSSRSPQCDCDEGYASQASSCDEAGWGSFNCDFLCVGSCNYNSNEMTRSCDVGCSQCPAGQVSNGSGVECDSAGWPTNCHPPPPPLPPTPASPPSSPPPWWLLLRTLQTPPAPPTSDESKYITIIIVCLAVVILGIVVAVVYVRKSAKPKPMMYRPQVELQPKAGVQVELQPAAGVPLQTIDLRLNDAALAAQKATPQSPPPPVG